MAADNGLYLEVSAKGTKTWKHRYQVGGSDRWYVLGHYPSMPLAEADRDNAEIKIRTDRGRSPVATDGSVNRDSTFEELFNQWHTRAKGPRSKDPKKSERPWSESHKRSTLLMFKKDVLPEYGHRLIKDIDEHDLKQILQTVEKRGATNQALQLYRRFRTLFNYAVTEKILQESPMSDLNIIGTENEKDRNLSEAEIKTFWTHIDSIGMRDDIRRVLKLTLITAQRPGEVLGAHSGEFDGDIWTIPATRTKNRKAHKVPLTATAKELFIVPEDGFCFPRGYSMTEDDTPQPVEKSAPAKELRKIMKHLGLEPFTPHDLRRSAASRLADMGHGATIPALLNHTIQGVTSVYLKGDMLTEKRKALEAWERRVLMLTGRPAAKVVNIK
jgi:integrase